MEKAVHVVEGAKVHGEVVFRQNYRSTGYVNAQPATSAPCLCGLAGRGPLGDELTRRSSPQYPQNRGKALRRGVLALRSHCREF